MTAARLAGYWVPMVVFGLLTWLESYVSIEHYPLVYMGKAAIVTTCLLLFRAPLADIRMKAGVMAPSVLIGLIVLILWVGIDRLVPYQHLGSRTAFDPTPLRGSSLWFAFLAVRFYGLVVMVPVMEEIFWRSFILRYLTQADFSRLAVGTFSAFALWVTVAGSALSHPEWLVGAVAGLVYALWLRRTGSLFATILAHATTNAALGVYVLATGQYQYW